MAASTSQPLHQLADGRLFAIDDVDDELEAAGDAAGTLGIDQVPREGAVEVEAREIEPDHLAQLGQRIFRLDQLIELVLQAIGLGLRAGDEGADARQDLDLVGVPVKGFGLPLDVGIKLLGAGERLVGGEDRLGKARGKGAAVFGRAGLDVDRPSLWRP
jgi:hypothetical protein